MDLHKEIVTKYDSSFSIERDQRDLALEDLQFAHVAGSMWDDNNAQESDRPRFEVNRVFHPINQIVGEQRQNRISMKVRAENDRDKDTADILDGMIRSIENESNFNAIKDTAFKEMVTGGIGAWGVMTEYREGTFEQAIKIKSIVSAASSVFYDPSATDVLKRDAAWMITTQDIDRKTFEKTFPDATISGLSEYNLGSLLAWQTRDVIRIGEYWVKVPVTKDLALMSDGSVLEMTKETKSVIDELAAQNITIVKERKEKSHTVVMYKFSSSEILEGPNEWASKYIPIVPFFGYAINIGGQQVYQGIVRNAKDSSRIYNYATSQAIETSALTPKDPYWLTPEQAKGHESQLRNFTTSNSPFLLYNPDSESPGPPARTGAPSVQQALILQIQQADMDIQNTTGLHNSSLGRDETDKSGVAILALNEQGNLSTFELRDSLVKAVEHTGRILIDLIPKIIDTERDIGLIAEDGQISSTTVNQQVLDTQTGQVVTLNDLSTGDFDVVSTSGPSFATKRSEGLNLLTRLAENPQFSQISADLIAKSIDFDFSEELTKRLRKQMLEAGLVEPNEEEIEAQPEPPEPSPSQLLEFENQKLIVEQQAALVDQLELQNEKIKADLEHKLVEVELRKAEIAKKVADTQTALLGMVETEVDINGKLLDQESAEQVNVAPPVNTRLQNQQVLNDAIDLTGQSIDQMTGLNLDAPSIPNLIPRSDQ